ncbi:hypothetical protein L1987_35876 [Smallanthus sonchifolius]|uniref:Uncharacterized protein n=1 Tax=Smallanthus sonchifolius TaxID=185202 RepID=A0ACB9HBZ9_9ASTR|nr:hypothetical protein L1987_35876 [Smallanthus sonchifolius]
MPRKKPPNSWRSYQISFSVFAQKPNADHSPLCFSGLNRSISPSSYPFFRFFLLDVSPEFISAAAFRSPHK